MFLGQTFDPIDIARVSFLAILELLLSADNAIVLAMVTRSLAPHLRKKALFVGAVSSLVFKGGSLFFASILIRYAWIQALAAIYLGYLCLRHFYGANTRSPLAIHNGRGFWHTVLLVEFFDFIFAIDSIVAAVAFITTIPSAGIIHPKLWIVYLGGVFGLIGVRFAAKLFSEWIERFPRMESSAYLMIGWIGIHLGTNALEATISLPESITNWFEPTFWSILVLLILFGFTKKHYGRSSL